MWLAQTAVLYHHGLPIRWRLTHKDAPRQVRTVGRIATPMGLVGAVVAYPLLAGMSIFDHYSSLFPLDETVRHAGLGAMMAILVLVGLFLIWLVFDRIDVEIRHARRRWIRRLLLLIPSAVLGAVVEESVFRGVLQHNLLSAGVSSTPAIIVAGAFFAAAHYVRSVKRKWTLFGHLALGILLSAAFASTQNLWLATGIHAGGILIILGARPFIRYEGPAWLTGESIFPFAGVPGIVGLALLTFIVLNRFAIQ